jgi:CubicO group peptidase (beta-lactamase class C family)
MSSCGFGAPDKDAPWGHKKMGDALVEVAPGPMADNAPILGPAGRAHCSLRDWGKFLAVVLAGMRGERGATMKRLYTPPAIDEQHYAGGWIFGERPWGGGTVAMHAGSNTMWIATAWLAPAKNLAFVSASNVFDPKTADAAFTTTIPKYAGP